MFARTRRLTLRPGWPEDAPALALAIGHQQVVANLSRVPWPYTLLDAEAFLTAPPPPGTVRLLITAHGADTPRLVGGVGITAERGRHELGYWLTPEAWGRGYATEAGRAMVAMARHALPIDRLTARCFLDNFASAKVLGKLGFVDTGRREHVTAPARGATAEAAVLELDVADHRQRPPSSFPRSLSPVLSPTSPPHPSLPCPCLAA